MSRRRATEYFWKYFFIFQDFFPWWNLVRMVLKTGNSLARGHEILKTFEFYFFVLLNGCDRKSWERLRPQHFKGVEPGGRPSKSKNGQQTTDAWAHVNCHSSCNP